MGIKYEFQEVVHKKEVVVSGTCDKCGKELKASKYIDGEPRLCCVELTTSHHDWGNDSWESHEDLVFCSLSCCLEFIKDYPASNTQEFDIEMNGMKSDTYIAPPREERKWEPMVPKPQYTDTLPYTPKKPKE